jgi:hypothetical protein
VYLNILFILFLLLFPKVLSCHPTIFIIFIYLLTLHPTHCPTPGTFLPQSFAHPPPLLCWVGEGPLGIPYPGPSSLCKAKCTLSHWGQKGSPARRTYQQTGNSFWDSPHSSHSGPTWRPSCTSAAHVQWWGGSCVEHVSSPCMLFSPCFSHWEPQGSRVDSVGLPEVFSSPSRPAILPPALHKSPQAPPTVWLCVSAFLWVSCWTPQFLIKIFTCFNVWDYNYIIFPSPCLSSLCISPCIPTPLISFKFMLYFTLVVVLHTHINTLTSKYINTTCSVCKMLLVCVFSGLHVWHWIIIVVLFYREDSSAIRIS